MKKPHFMWDCDGMLILVVAKNWLPTGQSMAISLILFVALKVANFAWSLQCPSVAIPVPATRFIRKSARCKLYGTMNVAAQLSTKQLRWAKFLQYFNYSKEKTKKWVAAAQSAWIQSLTGTVRKTFASHNAHNRRSKSVGRPCSWSLKCALMSVVQWGALSRRRPRVARDNKAFISRLGRTCFSTVLTLRHSSL